MIRIFYILLTTLCLTHTTGCSRRNIRNVVYDLIPVSTMVSIPTNISTDPDNIPSYLVNPVLKDISILNGQQILTLLNGATGYWVATNSKKTEKAITAYFFSSNGKFNLLQDLSQRLITSRKNLHQDQGVWGVTGDALVLGRHDTSRKIHNDFLFLVKSNNLSRNQYYIFSTEKNKKGKIFRGVITFVQGDTEKSVRSKSTCMQASVPPNIQCCNGPPGLKGIIQVYNCKARARGWTYNSGYAAIQYQESLNNIFTGRSPFTEHLFLQTLCGHFGGKC